MLREWRRNFLAGILTVLPLAITVGFIAWLFKKIDNIVISGVINFLPSDWVETNPGRMFWKLISLAVVVTAITFIGIITRNVLGRKMLELAEKLVNKIPLVNKIYTTTKEIRDTLIGGKERFNRVVLIEYPHKGIYTIGFLVNPTVPHAVSEKVAEPVLPVFLPTVPNPTSGLLIFVPEKEIIHLKLSVEDTMKLVISGGTIKL